jgi:hypothetical protein
MAPEQARGQELDARADVFALGTILWEVLTGELLFYDQEGDMATLMRVMTDEVRPPSTENEEIGPALDEVCLKSLERERDKRFPNVRALVAAVEDAARESKLLASHHEVADAIQELFAEQLERRRTAIKKHLAELGPEAGPVVASDVFAVPKLPRSNAAAEPAGHERSEPPRTRATKPATPASVGAPGIERPNRTAKLDKSQLPAPSVPPVADAASAPAPKPGGRPLVIAGLLLGLVGVLLLVAWIALRPGEDAVDPPTTVAAPPEPAPPAAMEEPAPEPPVVEPEPPAMEEAVAEPVVEEPVVETSPAATDRRGSSRTGSARSGTGRTDPAAGSDRTPTMDESPSSMQSRPPAIEDNPYLRR